MSDIFALLASYGTKPALGSPSGDPQVIGEPINVTMSLARKLEVEYTLTSDSPQTVTMGGLVAGASVLMINVTSGGKVKATVTSADGTSQSFPVDPLAMIISETVPFTALTLTRTAGAESVVKILMGEKL